jgi:hypothetical protein
VLLSPQQVTRITAAAVMQWESVGVMERVQQYDKVRVAGRAGVFLVLSVDEEKRTAELMPLDQNAPLPFVAPWSLLRPASQEREMKAL